MTFGIFLAPFHAWARSHAGPHPRYGAHQWLDYLGYDEVWIRRAPLGGLELIGLPGVFIAAAAERTRHIKLGSGLTSLPYHHPLMVASASSSSIT